MYDLFYEFLTQEAMLGSAMEYASTQIIARYLSVGLTIAVFFILCAIVYGCFKWIKNWFN